MHLLVLDLAEGLLHCFVCVVHSPYVSGSTIVRSGSRIMCFLAGHLSAWQKTKQDCVVQGKIEFRNFALYTGHNALRTQQVK